MVALVDSSRRSQTCEPRWATQRTPDRWTFGRRVAAVAEKLGKPLMPWQRMVADVAGEMVQDEDTGVWVPAYDEVLVTIPRQNGKTTLKLGWLIDRLVLWEAWDGKPQTAVYTAQTGSEARQKFRDDWIPMWRESPWWEAVVRPRYAGDNFGMDMRGGGWVKVLNSSESAGHGKTIDLALMDEIFADADSSREQAMTPAMITRVDNQTFMASTAGDGKSTFLNSKTDAGRASVAADRRRGIAFFEWSADDDADPEDPASYETCNPALGHTLTLASVQKALDKMAPNDPDWTERKRAFLNIPKRSGGERVFSEELWNSILRNVPLGGSLKLAVEADPDLTVASIAAASDSGVAEVLMHNAGVNWLLDELEAAGKATKAPVVIDMSGPVGYLAAQLEARRVKVLKFTATDTRHACAETYARISDHKVTVRPNGCDHCGQVPITAAVEGAVKQPVGDGWKWSRKTSTADVSPLMALSLAIGAQAGIGASKPLDPIVAFGN